MPQIASSRAGARACAAMRVLALCCACVSGGAFAQAPAAQTPAAQIFIPGRGDPGGADAARMNAMLDAPGARTTTSTAAGLASASPAEIMRRDVATARNDEARSGMIRIPGPGERQTAGSQGSAPQVVTIAAPGAVAASATTTARNGAAGLQRVNVGSSASGVASVVVDANPGRSANGVKPVANPAAHSSVNPATNAAALKAADARAAAIARYAAAAAAAGVRPPAAVNAAAPANTAQSAAPQPVPAGQEDGELIRATALKYLQQQSAGLPGHVTVTVAPVFPRGLAACAELAPFTPPGAQAWGHTTVGVRCVGAKPWTLYVAARVAVEVTYYTAGRQIEPGQLISGADLVPREGDLANLPRTIITEPSQATGALALMRISAGLPLRTDMVRSAASVVIGQTVKVVAEGTDFSISAQGSAMNTAAPGQTVRVRTAGGQIISGIVKDANTVQVPI